MTLIYPFNTGLYRSNGKIIPTLATNGVHLCGDLVDRLVGLGHATAHYILTVVQLSDVSEYVPLQLK